MKDLIKQILEDEIENLDSQIEPSRTTVKNICDSEKFCKAQGKITFGQLKELVREYNVILSDTKKLHRIINNLGKKIMVKYGLKAKS